ncbi:hypothetical protein P9112_005129 [Eukaryota sp. TZLM1-RC]
MVRIHMSYKYPFSLPEIQKLLPNLLYMSIDSCVNAPFRNNNFQNYDAKRVAIVYSIIELENVNTALFAVNEAESSSCADSCLASLLNAHDSDSPRAVWTCTPSFSKEFAIMKEDR